MKKTTLILTLNMLFLLIAIPLQAQTTYVNSNLETGLDDGTSWTNAYQSLESALANTTSGEIRVASGTYKPSAARMCTNCTAAEPRENYFLITTDITLKGSYDPDTDTQDYSTPSILDGDIGSVGVATDNSYNVVITIGLTTAALDGFTITNGFSNRGSNRTIGSENILSNGGGGMYNATSFPSISNTTFSGNSASNGGGMYNATSFPSISNTTFSGNSATTSGGGMYNAASSPSISNTTFSGNSASNFGGGMYNVSTSSPSIFNTTFSGNSATTSGGGMYNDTSSPSISNTTFSENSATSNGGGMFNRSSSPSITNTTFSGNSASSSTGGGMHNTFSSAPTLYNTVLYGNGTDVFISGSSSIATASANNFSENFVQTGFTALTADPFINSTNPIGTDGIWHTADDGLVPKPASVLIDAGDNSHLPCCITIDIKGEPRIFDGDSNDTATIDVGAYEFYVNDYTPMITSLATATAIAENSGAGQEIYTITATDGDAGTTLMYAIAGTDAGLFTVNASTGAVTLTADPDYEIKSSYSFEVTANDGAKTSTPLTVSLAITDIDETLSVDDNTEEAVFTVSPNPATAYIFLAGLQQAATYEVYTILGASVLKGTLSVNAKIEIEQLTNGVYFLKINNGTTLRFIKK